MEPKMVSVRLSVEDWQAIILSLRHHADATGPNSAHVAASVGRSRMRYIVALITSKLGKVP